jgi:hypothetical protein
MNTKGDDSVDNLKLKLKSTNALPQYLKDIYLNKISDKKFSYYWVKRIGQIMKQLEKVISKK